MPSQGDPKKACWNCTLKRQVWYVNSSDSFCSNCGVKDPFVDCSDEVCNITNDIASSKKKLKHLNSLMANDYTGLGAIIGGLAGIVVGAILLSGVGPLIWIANDGQRLIAFVLMWIVGAVLGSCLGYVLAPEVIKSIQVSITTRHLNGLKQRKQKLTRSIYDTPLLALAQMLREEIDQLHSDIQEIENRYSQIAPSSRKDHKAERDKAIAIRESEIALRNTKLWDIDRVRWINRYEYCIARRETVTRTIYNSQLDSMRNLYKDGEQLRLSSWRNTESMEALDKALLFCKAKISDLEVQKEALLLVEKTELWKPLISDPYNITAKECDFRKGELEEAIKWVENQIQEYRRQERSHTNPELLVLVSALEGVLQNYKIMQEELRTAAFRHAISNREFAGSSVHSEALVAILDRHDTILASVNAQEAAIREIALVCDGEVDRLLMQQREFASLRQLDGYQVKPAEAEQSLSQINISR